MNFEELKKIDEAARTAKFQRGQLRQHASRLAALRTNGDQITAAKVISAMTTAWSGLNKDEPHDTLMAVLDEQIADILRIAELRLEARARAADTKHRILTEQLRSFFDEETRP